MAMSTEAMGEAGGPGSEPAEVEPAVEFTDVTMVLGGEPRVDSLTWRVPPGRVYGVLGPNGAGKSTVVNLITGLLAATSGSVRVGGLDPVRDAVAVRRLIGLVPQADTVYPELSGRENLRFHGALYVESMREVPGRISEILQLVELTDRADDAVKTYSGGMRRRLCIGRALMHRPRVLLLDEPTLGVDVQGTYRIWDYVKALRDEGTTVIVTTNVMAEADYLCDDVVILDHGRRITSGSPAELTRRSGVESLGEVFVAHTGRNLRD